MIIPVFYHDTPEYQAFEVYGKGISGLLVRSFLMGFTFILYIALCISQYLFIGFYIFPLFPDTDNFWIILFLIIPIILIFIFLPIYIGAVIISPISSIIDYPEYHISVPWSRNNTRDINFPDSKIDKDNKALLNREDTKVIAQHTMSSFQAPSLSALVEKGSKRDLFPTMINTAKATDNKLQVLLLKLIDALYNITVFLFPVIISIYTLVLYFTSSFYYQVTLVIAFFVSSCIVVGYMFRIMIEVTQNWPGADGED